MNQGFDEYEAAQSEREALHMLPEEGFEGAFARRPGPLRRLWNWLTVTQPDQAEAVYLEQAPVAADEMVSPQRREQINEALRQWRAATAYFENVTDPALVDYAVFDMEAAQKRYMYLLRSAQQERRAAMQACETQPPQAER